MLFLLSEIFFGFLGVCVTKFIWRISVGGDVSFSVLSNKCIDCDFRNFSISIWMTPAHIVGLMADANELDGRCRAEWMAVGGAAREVADGGSGGALATV